MEQGHTQATVKCWTAGFSFSVKLRPLSLQGGKAASVRVVDVPGHPRVRSRFEQYAERACGVVFVVDAVDFLPHKTEVAEQLYEARLTAWWCAGTSCQCSNALIYFQRFSCLFWHASCGAPVLLRPLHRLVWRLRDGMQVLTYPAVYKRRLPLLLACNKADQGARAHTVDFLRRRLEREVAALAMTRLPCLTTQELRRPCACAAQDSNRMPLCTTGLCNLLPV